MIRYDHRRGNDFSVGGWGIFENFCVKSNLTVCRPKVTFNCKLQKKIGETGCTSCSPNNFVEGAPALAAPPVSATNGYYVHQFLFCVLYLSIVCVTLLHINFIQSQLSKKQNVRCVNVT